MSENKSITGHLAACVTILIWGTTFISTKVLLRAFTPVEILFIRFVIGYLALWIVRPKSLSPGWRREGYFAAAGLCGVTLYYLFENIALTYTLASNVGVIISIAPFFTALFSHWFLGNERPGPRFFAGFVIAIAGVGLMSFSGGGKLELNPMGDLLAVVAAVVWAVYSTLAKKISAFGYNTIETTRRTFFYGLLFMVPALLFMDFHVNPGALFQSVNLGNLLFLGFGASALCFVTWNFAVKLLGSVKTSVYIYIVPVVTAITSAIFLGERISQTAVCGILLTLAGLFLSESKAKKRVTV